MTDTFTKTTHRSYGNRIGNSFKGMLTGLVLIGLGIWAIVWNEGRSVKRIKELNRGEKDVISVDSSSVNPENDNKLIHFYGRAVTDAILTDPQFGISRTNDLQLVRKTEIYQWKEDKKEETKQNLGGSEDTVTTYTYNKEWDSYLADSSKFEHPEGHENPASIKYPSKTYVADNVRIGAYRIPVENVAGIGRGIDIFMGTDSNRVVPEGIPTNAIPNDYGWYVPGKQNGNPGIPQVGDERIVFSYVPQCDATFIAVQLGSTFAQSSPKYGPVLQRTGICTSEELFESARSANSFVTWILRIIGFALIFGGFKGLLNPLKVLADVVPFIGKIIGFGTGLISFILALVISLVTIAIAWLAYRPLISIPLLAGAGALIFYLVKKSKQQPNP